MTNSKRYTVLGAGQIGTKLARVLATRGHDVRLVRRSAPGPATPGVTWLQGDVTDDAFADQACAGSAAVFGCLNPPDYADWTELMIVYRAGWEAARRAGARVVQLDNLYGYGEPEQTPFDESTPMRPVRHKGEIRKRVHDELMAMHERGEIKATLGRASDYFGPQTPGAVVFRPDVYDRILAGKTIYATGNLDTRHGYSYSPDVAEGLATLAEHDVAFGRAWHLPMAFTGTTRELFAEFARQAGTSPRLRRIPGWALRALGLASPLLRSLADMNYQWELPYVMDDSAFRSTFGVEPTPVSEAVRATLDDHRGPSSPASDTPSDVARVG